jgi:phospholipase/carboxylesterase
MALAGLTLDLQEAKATMPSTEPDREARQGLLRARPGAADTASGSPRPGVQRLPVEGSREALLLVPTSYRTDRPTALVVGFHGAGGEGQQILDILGGLAELRGFLLLAPSSRGQTWDVILRAYGRDVAALDRTLGHVFSGYAIEPARVAAAGFSDGASYALSLGLANGDLFTHLLAFSPGFMSPSRSEGRPRLFISHGVKDTVLPIAHTSRQLVPRLEASGYALDYREFADGHVVPPEIAREAVDWFLGE